MNRKLIALIAAGITFGVIGAAHGSGNNDWQDQGQNVATKATVIDAPWGKTRCIIAAADGWSNMPPVAITCQWK